MKILYGGICMANKKIYVSPEIEVIKFSFENILTVDDTDDPQYIKQSNPDNMASGGTDVEW